MSLFEFVVLEMIGLSKLGIQHRTFAATCLGNKYFHWLDSDSKVIQSDSENKFVHLRTNFKFLNYFLPFWHSMYKKQSLCDGSKWNLQESFFETKRSEARWKYLFPRQVAANILWYIHKIWIYLCINIML